MNIQTLPNDASPQREQLVRRLAAQDSSIDVMSLDPPFIAEFANAGFLRPFAKEDEATFTDGVLDGPLQTASWDGKLVAAPFWANTQLLWFRKSVAQAAGVDPTAADFTWDQMIKAAESQDKVIGVQANRYEGYMVWINALVVSAGGQILGRRRGRQGRQARDQLAGRGRGGRHRRRPGPVLGRAARRCRPPARRRPAPRSRAPRAASWSTGRTSTGPPRATSKAEPSTSPWSTTSAGLGSRR